MPGTWVSNRAAVPIIDVVEDMDESERIKMYCIKEGQISWR